MLHVMSNKGTPKGPNACIEAFIFSTFNENLTAVEQAVGTFRSQHAAGSSLIYELPIGLKNTKI